MFTITDNTAIYHEFTPCKVEALVSQETQCELQAGEQEEIAEINQAQHLKLLHSCKHVSMFNHANGSVGCMFLVHRLFGGVMYNVLTFFCRWVFYPGNG